MADHLERVPSEIRIGPKGLLLGDLESRPREGIELLFDGSGPLIARLDVHIELSARGSHARALFFL